MDISLPGLAKSEVCLRVEKFKTDTLHIMYGMADSIAGVDGEDIHAIRACQCLYLESLTPLQLAALGVFAKVLGMGYYRLMKEKYPKNRQRSIRDRGIVFEDRLLAYGPFLAWAIVMQPTRKICEWSHEVLENGLEDMETFETGRVQGYASLQSAVWKAFCATCNCNMFDSWDVAQRMVEKEILSYKL